MRAPARNGDQPGRQPPQTGPAPQTRRHRPAQRSPAPARTLVREAAERLGGELRVEVYRSQSAGAASGAATIRRTRSSRPSSRCGTALSRAVMHMWHACRRLGYDPEGLAGDHLALVASMFLGEFAETTILSSAQPDTLRSPGNPEVRRFWDWRATVGATVPVGLPAATGLAWSRWRSSSCRWFSQGHG
jgi:hypothetical protein